MVQQENDFFSDADVPTRIMDVVKNALEYLTLVSPYVDLPGHLEQELRLAVRQRGVSLTVIVRRDPDDTFGGRNGKESISRLAELGAQLKAVPDLHAKIYLSESAVVVSSMNLLRSSWSNSMEFGAEISDGPMATDVRSYVRRLATLGTDVPVPNETAAVSKARRSPEKKPVAGKATHSRAKKAVAEKRKPYRPKKPASDGHCIRCGASISLDPSHPLCPKCYGIWAQYENEEYSEEYCHACGKKHEATYAKPLCRACYRRLAS
ncbi:MAG: hypothetical protein HQ548_03930 [Chloroflexi bacterium]|nr:hypothetical protein [Chloroflexota bacterium]